MDNRCDIYNVTLKSCKKTTTGGLHYEQEVYQGVFQSDIRAIPQGIKRSQAYNIKRILCQCRIQQEICHPKTERTAPWKRFFQAKTPEEKHIWVTGNINIDGCMGSSGISMFRKTEGNDSIVAAVDTKAISFKPDTGETIDFDQRQADRPQAQRQEGSGWQANLWPHKAGDAAEASYSHKNRQLGRKEPWVDRSGYGLPFRQQCRREVRLYSESNRYSHYMGGESGSIGKRRRCGG